MTEYEMKLVPRQDIMEKARWIVKNGGIADLREDGEAVSGSVIDEYNRHFPRITISEGKLTSASCTCRFSYEDGSHLCAHAAALGMYMLSPERQAQKERERTLLEGKDFLRVFTPKKTREESIRLEVTLFLDKEGASASVKAGASRMYVVKDIGEFAREYFAQNALPLGKGKEIDASRQCLTESDERILQVLDEAALDSADKNAQKNTPLNAYQLKRLLRALADKDFSAVLSNMRTIDVSGIADGLPEMRFRLSLGSEGGFVLSGVTESSITPLTQDCAYILCGDLIYETPENARPAIRRIAGKSRRFSYTFAPEDGIAIISDIVPAFEGFSRIKIDEDIAIQIINEPLVARVELDSAGGGIKAALQFSYGGITIDPLSGIASGHQGILRRDYQKERQVVDLLTGSGFVAASDGRYYIAGDDNLYLFLYETLPELSKIAELFASQELTRIKPRRMPLRGSLRVGLRGIEFSMMLEDVEADNMPLILSALRERKKYVRLTDGSFLTLDAAPHWEDLAREVADNGVLQGDHIELQAYRTIYLNSLLDAAGLDVERDQGVRAMTDFTRFESVPAPIEGLRQYQVHGFNWLRQLYDMRLGGILADDMGLGKTVQMLAAIKYAKEKEGAMTSLIIAPTSLIYNWEKEIQKFTPDLSVAVLEGSGEMRNQQIDKHYGCDVLIVSYAQIRRDIGKLAARRYRFCVLDEAQNIKNYRSVGALAVKQIRAKARFALTGTPMENHIGELWSVFDFVLPGYLGGRTNFVSRFAEGNLNEELAIKIRPFLMRRLKKDVLSELPDKLEHKVLVEMNEYQHKVYRAMLSRYKADIVAPAAGDFNRNRMKILAAITRLRQLCCHPSLFLDGYQGGSGKLDVLLGIVQQCVGEGRKMLVFSQFTSMLSIIRDSLDAIGINSYYLDGEVPAKERSRLCDRFNEDDTPVFLISTKAGGTGLNLTGADTVVHFDPWWNPAVEDQATDRAHRIGQEKKVHVVKLITRNTIEEKVSNLQLQKKEMVDAIIRPGEVLPSSLSKDAILALFD